MHRDRPVKASRAAPEALQVSDSDLSYVEGAIDDCLARMDADAIKARLARKQDELATTFVRCPAWAAERLPALAMAALRLELERSLPLTSFKKERLWSPLIRV